MCGPHGGATSHTRVRMSAAAVSPLSPLPALLVAVSCHVVCVSSSSPSSCPVLPPPPPGAGGPPGLAGCPVPQRLQPPAPFWEAAAARSRGRRRPRAPRQPRGPHASAPHPGKLRPGTHSWGGGGRCVSHPPNAAPLSLARVSPPTPAPIWVSRCPPASPQRMGVPHCVHPYLPPSPGRCPSAGRGGGGRG